MIVAKNLGGSGMGGGAGLGGFSLCREEYILTWVGVESPPVAESTMHYSICSCLGGIERVVE